jgi:hypothetical protein
MTMTNRTSLVCGAAAGVLSSLVCGAAAQAEPAHHRHHRLDAAAPREDGALKAEVAALKAQVDAMQAWRDSQAANAAQTQAQMEQLRAQLAETQAREQAAEAQVANQIQTIPGEVKGEVATAVAEAAPKTDKLYIKGVSLQFGGFVAAESVFRNHNEEADIGSSFAAIPFANTIIGHTDETRFTARQSRITGLIQGDASPTIHLAGYAEADFLGAAQTANSNESNSYQPRLRVFYTTVDWDQDFGGVHLLAGQNWSLATLQGNGITPRAEQVPLTVDAQYVPGFTWARQPQLRVTADLDKKVWLAVSVENPQITYSSSGQFLTGVSVVDTGAAGAEFNSVNTLSLNRVPDVIGKVALQEDVDGHALHVEAFGIYRDFYARVDTAGVSGNEGVTGGGVGGGAIFAVIPQLLDLQASGIVGDGIGRYGSAQLPDATLSVDGTIHPINEYEVLFGGTLHLGPKLDVYAYAGEEQERQTAFTNATGKINNGVGNLAYNNTGCFVEAGSCSANTRTIDQGTIGFWDRPYVGAFGRLQWGIQYSYTERHAFEGIGGAPVASENMIFTSIRYYPF